MLASSLTCHPCLMCLLCPACAAQLCYSATPLAPNCSALLLAAVAAGTLSTTPLTCPSACCRWHFFYNSPDLEFLVALQALLTVVSNCTCWWAAYRIYKASMSEQKV